MGKLLFIFLWQINIFDELNLVFFYLFGAVGR